MQPHWLSLIVREEEALHRSLFVIECVTAEGKERKEGVTVTTTAFTS
jgi:hypothetical protein